MAETENKPSTVEQSEEKTTSVNENGNVKETTEKSEEAGENDNEPTALEAQILRQIEYYFGDINLPRDKFMLEQIKLDDGWIPMSTMLKFQRLAKLSDDPKVVAHALRHSELMEVDDSGEEVKIRRLPDCPLPEVNDERRKELQERTIYCKGFPLDMNMNSIIDFFTPYEPLDNIIMRKYKDQVTKTYKFKGSVFITFGSKEKAEEFLNIESVKCGDTELIRKWQLVYIEDKKKEVLEYKLKRSQKSGGKEIPDSKDLFPKGAVIHLKGDFSTSSREDIKQKFQKLGYETAFIAFNKGDEEAYVRLHEENLGSKILEKTGKEIEVLGCKLEARVLEGEEEEKFLEKARLDRNAHMKKCQQAKQGGRRNKGGRNKNNRKRKGEAESTSPAKKRNVASE